jgi:hypothetical protein
MAELLAKIEAYADGRLDRAAFERWFHELSFDGGEASPGDCSCGA